MVKSAEKKLEFKNQELYNLLQSMGRVHIPDGTNDKLAYLALKTILDTQQVDTLLVGMRRQSYVNDVMALLQNKNERMREHTREDMVRALEHL